MVEGAIAVDDPVWSGAELALAGPLEVQATAEGSPSRGIWLRGTLSGRVQASCRRCLEPLELQVAESFELLFDPKTPESDGDLTLYGFDPKADELDLRPALRERLLLALPVFPVCREDCPGLCGRCGQSLSEGQCECGAAEPDPRWGPLRALREQG